MDAFTLHRSLIRLEQRVKKLETLTDTQSARITQLFNLLALYGAQSERAGQDMSPLAAGASTVDLTWPNPFPDTAYIVIPTVIVPGVNLGQCFAELAAKTTAGCTIAVRNTSGGALGTALIDVVAIRT